MRPVSERWLRTVRGSHQAVVEARVVAPGQTGVDPAGTTLQVLNGDVQMSATADIRSTVDMTALAPWPTGAGSLLAPYGDEVFVRRGIRYGDGSTEWVSLGYHRIDAIEQDGVDGEIRVAASDRMAGLRDARLLQPVQHPAATPCGSVVDQLVREVYPSAVIEWDDPAVAAAPLGRTLVGEESRWEYLQELVTSLGKTWWWDYRGALRIASPPPSSQPVWRVDSGERGVLMSLRRAVSREGVYNAVVASGEAADSTEPPRAVAYDLGVDSPTRWGGPFGMSPRFYSSPFITDVAQARSAAAALLQQGLGLPYNVDLTWVPNPALEVLDPIVVAHPRGEELHVVETLRVPLAVEAAMTGTTREQTLVAMEVS